MIRLLGEEDREPALAFLDRDHELNLIMIYDVEHFGIEDRGHPFQGRYYGAFREGILDGIGKACLNVARENAPAQRVYRGIGFEKICDYRMAHFAH